MRVRLALAALAISVFINGQVYMAAVARRINMGTHFTNRKLLSIYSESVPRSGLKATTYSYTEKQKGFISNFHCLS